MIYLDLDGVFVDFNKKMIELLGPDYKKLNVHTFWREVGKEKNLFLDLDETEDAQSLFQSIKQIAEEAKQELSFLTAIPYSTGNLSTSRDDKIAWVRKHLSKIIPVYTVVGGINKAKYAKEGDILIDDTEKNLVAWGNVGGIAIFHQTNSSSPTILRLISVLQTQNLLK